MLATFLIFFKAFLFGQLHIAILLYFLSKSINWCMYKLKWLKGRNNICWTLKNKIRNIWASNKCKSMKILILHIIFRIKSRSHTVQFMLSEYGNILCIILIWEVNTNNLGFDHYIFDTFLVHTSQAEVETYLIHILIFYWCIILILIEITRSFL